MPSQHEPSDLDFTKPGKWRTMAIQQLFKNGHTIAQVSKLSGMPLSRLCEILGTEVVLIDLYVNGMAMKEISKLLCISLPEVAKCLGGISRSGNHRYAVDAEEEV